MGLARLFLCMQILLGSRYSKVEGEESESGSVGGKEVELATLDQFCKKDEREISSKRSCEEAYKIAWD